MRKVKVFVSYILVFAMLFSLLPLDYLKAEAVSQVPEQTFTIQSYKYNSTSKKFELTVSWRGTEATNHIHLEYFDYSVKSDGTEVGTKVPLDVYDPTVDASSGSAIYTATFALSKRLEPTKDETDRIYEFKFTSYSSDGIDESTGTVFYTPSTRFIGGRPERTASGVFESGEVPELSLTWHIPKVFIADTDSTGNWTGTGTWVSINDSTGAATNYIGKEMGLASNSRVQYEIGIDTDYNDVINNDASIGVSVKYSDSEYQAYNAKDTSVTSADVTFDSNANTMSVNVIGGKDGKQVNFTDDRSKDLYLSDLKSGTVYYANIKPVFYNSADNKYYTIINSGESPNENKESTSLINDETGISGYTYTPIHFKLSRNSDYVFATIYPMIKDANSNFYYSIQTHSSPLSDNTEWNPQVSKMTLPDGEDVINVPIQDDETSSDSVDVNKYYRVLVTNTVNSDEYYSLNILYDKSQDTAQAPIPAKLGAESSSELKSQQVNYPTNKVAITARSNDVLIRFKKVSNYDKLTFNILLSTNKEDLDKQLPLEYKGEFPSDFPENQKDMKYNVHYRWVKAISGKDMQEVKYDIDGDKTEEACLEYTLDGFSLFNSTLYDSNGNAVQINTNLDKYPTWLLENTTYFIKMFTTQNISANEIEGLTDQKVNGVNDNLIDINDFIQKISAEGKEVDQYISQASNIASFTTLSGSDKQVPIPTDFAATGEGVDKDVNYINLKFKDSDINLDDYKPLSYSGTDSKIVYELYMASGSSDNPTYFQIGSTDDSFLDDGEKVNGFTKVQPKLGNGIWTVQVPNLYPNTIYRFKLRLKLVYGDTTKTSDYTSIVSVTTSKVNIIAPNDATKIPRAPENFINSVKDGKLVLSGTGAGLQWDVLENDVTYQLIATSAKIDENAVEKDYEEDSVYKKFQESFGPILEDTSKIKTDNVNYLNPNYTGTNFTVSSSTTTNSTVQSICNYNITDFMTPNTIYYYSIRAKRAVKVTTSSGTETEILYSKWVTIPITSMMVDAPLDIENIQDYEIGLQWTGDATKSADNYFIKLKKSSESDSAYTVLNVKKAVITKDGDIFYGRITGLDAGTDYNINVYTTSDTENPIKLTSTSSGTSGNVYSTRNAYHSVEIRWEGVKGYSFEIDMRDESTGGYTTLTRGTDYEIINTEKSQDLVGTQYYYFYALISKVPETLSDGTTVHNELSSNTKYHIKVRSVMTSGEKSNAIGPVTARTSFLQSDYDNNDNINDIKTKLVDRVDEIERKPYYQLNYVPSTTNTILLKGDMLEEEINASQYHNLKLDLTSISSSGRLDEIYIPQVLGDTLRSSGGSIDFVLDKAEYKLVSTVLDQSTYKEAMDLKDDYSEKEVWFKLSISRPDGGTEGLEASVTPVSDVNIINMKVLAVSETYSDLRKDFTDKVYNSETGLLKEKKDELDDLYINNKGSVTTQQDYLVDSLIQEVEEELADYVKASVEGGYIESSSTTKTSIILGKTDINEFSASITVKVFINQTDDFCQPYAIYTDSKEWRKLDSLNKTNDTVTYELIKAGKYLIGVSGSFSKKLPSSHWAYQIIVDFNNKYNIADVFSSNGDFDPDKPVSLKEGILVLDKVFIKDSVNGESLAKKASKLGLSSYFPSITPMKDLEREQAATLYTASYCLKNGLSISTTKPSSVVVFNDATDISKLHYKNVEFSVASGFMENEADGSFNPSGYVTRADFIASLQKALQ